MYNLIVTAMNDVDPQAWLADVFGAHCRASHPKNDELLSWNWRKTTDPKKAAA